MSNRTRTASVLTFSGLALGALLAPSAHAEADGPIGEKTQTVHFRGGECQLKSDTPHYTPRAGSVIFKTRVECVGTEAPVVRINGTMLYSPAGLPGAPTDGPLQQVATSSQDQLVQIGESKTYYTPMENTEKLTLPGTYQGVAAGEIVAPQHSNLATFTTQRNYDGPHL